MCHQNPSIYRLTDCIGGIYQSATVESHTTTGYLTEICSRLTCIRVLMAHMYVRTLLGGTTGHLTENIRLVLVAQWLMSCAAGSIQVHFFFSPLSDPSCENTYFLPNVGFTNGSHGGH